MLLIKVCLILPFACIKLCLAETKRRNWKTKMLGSVALRSPPLHSCPAFALEIAGPDLSSRSSRPAPRSTVLCDAQRSHASIPKLEPFSRSRIERWLKDPPFLQKTKNDLGGTHSAIVGFSSVLVFAVLGVHNVTVDLS